MSFLLVMRYSYDHFLHVARKKDNQINNELGTKNKGGDDREKQNSLLAQEHWRTILLHKQDKKKPT